MTAKQFDDRSDIDILIADENIDIIVYRVADEIYSEDDPLNVTKVMSNVVKALKEKLTVVLDFEEVDYPERDRVLTAARGAAHFLEGSAIKVSEDIYIIVGNPDVGIIQWPRGR